MITSGFLANSHFTDCSTHDDDDDDDDHHHHHPGLVQQIK
jgi:hypothetical protein